MLKTRATANTREMTPERFLDCLKARLELGARAALPWTGEMDAKTTRDLALLAVLWLFCAGFAWILDHLVFGLVFFALGVAAALETTWEP